MIDEIQRRLNSELLPEDYYALAEQQSGPFGPDVLTLQLIQPPSDARNVAAGEPVADGNVLLAPPQIELTAEADLEFYRRKQNMVAVRHVSGDEIIAVVEIFSPGNKSSSIAMQSTYDLAFDAVPRRWRNVLV